jgi:tRNA(Ile)-lysidine synthase
VTSSGSNRTTPAGDLSRRALDAFDILAGQSDAIAVAVSGGSDSTALLVLAADWARANGKRIAAATVDHGLRPEAKEEAAGVARLCAAVGVTHAILHWKRPAKLRPVGQAEARRARHGLLAGWAHEARIGILALGHTRDDRIETFLIRARQGSGWRGLAGPLPSGPSPAWPEGRGLRLIRPLLAFGREDLRAELRRRGMAWAEDPSNKAERFERVRMRALAGRMDETALAQTLRVMDGLAHMRAAVMAEARLGLGLGAETPPRREALDRLAGRLTEPSGLAAGVTLGGAWLKLADGALVVSQAPPRRGEAAGNGPAWDRAQALLADPGLAALAV